MEPSVEIDPRLSKLSDTEIVLNFARALAALYPCMRAVYAHCYDPYDDVVEPLFHALVYESFAGKYGIPVPEKACHVYESVGNNYRQIHYIRVLAKSLPLRALCEGAPFELENSFLAEKELVFIAFGDGHHNLTAGEEEGDSYDVTFHLTEVEVFDPHAPANLNGGLLLWLPNESVEYEFVPNANSLKD